ncbi:MAG: DNA polymerase III subunit beta [Patescibacteria group bacterium]|nr:DNA polymerase III subunit beta [Patescibacteria group bacterium]MDD5121260.1 DNA polymerase III subunit beta [Patescibacteria group bacterium]MDD5222162.1 DNA polymerase III subunit beta [Patescibacteria group bacterium]MDD5395821.1 DNA polymerase III subunit beta [Patescibacteria group bacterium]
MKLTVLQENLNKILSQLSRLTSTKATLPILNNVLIEAEKGVLKLSTTNLEIAISTQIRAKVEREAKITIPCQIFANFVNLLDKGPIDIELLESNEVSLKSKNSVTKIKGTVAEEFPIIPQVDHKNFFKVNALDLKQALDKVAFTVSPNETRAEISGVLFSFNPENDILTLVGTDSYRLAEKSFKVIESNIKESHSLIVPARTIQELSRIVEEKGVIEIYFAENQVLFIYEATEIISRIINGEYPDYRQIIPQTFATRALMEKEALLRAVKAVSLFTKIGLNDINLKFQASGDKTIVSSLNSQVGESQIDLKAEIKGEDNEIIFNYRYLLDGLLNIGGDEVSLNIVNDNSAAVITSPTEKDYLYLVMPIKK